MNRYEPRTPRTIFGFAAVFLTAATLAIAVMAPAAMDIGSREVTVLTQSDSQRPAAASATTTSIDVVAVRATRFVPAVHRGASAKTGVPG